LEQGVAARETTVAAALLSFRLSARAHSAQSRMREAVDKKVGEKGHPGSAVSLPRDSTLPYF
jgi:hypothetical protein